MKLKFAAVIAAWISFAPTFLYGQQPIKITGTVVDTDQKPVDGGSVLLFRFPDSVLVKTNIIATDGTFTFEKVNAGKYTLQVQALGYREYHSPATEVSADLAWNTIILERVAKAIGEVAITAQKPFAEQKIDRTVVNPDALISNAGGTALDVLEKSPGVIVDPNGAISLNGKGVTIFVDDKPTYLSGTELETYLRSLSAAAIDQLELMANPPARYDASGNGGVINIRTKRGKAKGFNGAINLAYTQGKYAKTNDNANFNYRSGKMNLTGNAGFNYNNGFNDLLINRHFRDNSGTPTSDFIQNSLIRRKGQNYSTRLGFDYYATENSTWGINLTGSFSPRNVNSPVNSRFQKPSGTLDSTIVAQNKEHSASKNGGVNLNYRYHFGKSRRQLAADADYLRYSSDKDQIFDNKSYASNNQLKISDLLSGGLPAKIDIYSAKADYDHPLAEGISLSGGLKSSFTRTNNIADYFYTLNGATNPDYGKTNHFIYRETINAAYANFSREGKRISVQGGLRMESTFSKGHQLGNTVKPDSVFSRSYTSLFPTAYVQYKLDSAGNNQLRMNYGRRIERPYYEDLNPFLSPLDKFTYYTGNPFLRPSFGHNVELTYSYKSHLNVTLSYNRTNNEVNETIEIVDGIYYSRPGNIGRTTVKTLAFDAGFAAVSWLDFKLFGRVSEIHSVSDFYTGKLDNAGAYFFLRPVFSFKFPKDWTAQLDGGYQSDVTNAQFISKARGRVNLAFAKKLSASTSVRLVGNDLFYTFKNNGIINNLAGTDANWTNANDSRTVVLSLSYRFGKAIANQRNHDANGAEAEQSRVKN
ncbi:outer membrane beta-barrel protein [Hufsiella ginkgonis]|uniref:TonB-dependent receptor n=1 Tax=Hufsiella ginkgonis TaxID=2695274 RepID=A0A7K1XTU5_9SPHI|nr:outer membrane beta-barrel protein [Hufsiella ginkgonis]MXV14402.1 TonB-dependent receptor [Hufsiella ginkgonis]